MTEPANPASAPSEPDIDQPEDKKRAKSSRRESSGPSAVAPVESQKRKRSGTTQTRSRRSSRIPFWKAPWLPIWRPIAAFWKYWKPNRIVQGGLNSSASVVAGMLKFEGTDFEMKRSDGRVLVRTWPSKRTLWNPLWWVTNAGSFAVRWLTTRRFLPLLVALPGVIAALGLVGIISAGSVISPGTESMLYKRMLATEITEIDVPSAKLALDALIRIDPNNLDAVFDRGLIEDKLGNTEAANGIMSELATSAKSPNAALWLAKSVGDTAQVNTWTKQQLINYHNWLQVAVQNAPDNPVPRRMLGDLRALVGNKQGAYDALLPIADVDTDTSYLVYFLQQELGHANLATARGEKLIRNYKQRLQIDPRDVTARIQYALLLTSMENSTEAKALLEEGLVYATTAADRLRLNNATSDILVTESRNLAETDKSPRGLIERLSKLKQAAAADPTNPHLLDAITQACFEAAESKDNELLILRESLVQNIDPDTSHFILGTIALNEGNMEVATQHLELAARNNPNLPGLLNNLAHAICFGKDPDLERALRMANAANAGLPNHPYLHETRGQIYLRLKRYTDAIADFEVALNAPELRPNVREALAQAYEATGQTEIAKRQRDMASQGR